MLTLAVALVLGCSAPQRIEVVAPSTRATTAQLSLWQCGHRVAGPWTARVGRNGLSSQHREGDGTTPLGTFRLGPVVYGLDPNPGVRLGYHQLVCGDWWDEDVASADYNRFRHVPCGTPPPFRGDSEALWRQTIAYREFAVVEYNVAPVRPGRGSAIFLHDDKGRPTSGCISLPRPELLQVLRWLRPSPAALIEIRIA
jgi:L,D-peptidoglycan transpeptidase YkuD (ErfK/YbiS/YcfS/YnhG family)